VLQRAGKNPAKLEKAAVSVVKTKKGGEERSPPPFRLGQQFPATYFLNLKLPEEWQLEG
jgi:hypothetical protein